MRSLKRLAVCALIAAFWGGVASTMRRENLTGSGQHCGCPASDNACALPCSSCCAPVCTFQPTTTCCGVK